MSTFKPPALLAALTLTVACAIGCASAGGAASGEPVSGLFDEGDRDDDYRGAPAERAMAPGYAAEAEAMPAPQAMATASDAGGGGVFDFMGETIDGAFAKKSARPARANRAPSAPPSPPPPPHPVDPDGAKPTPADKVSESSEGATPAKRQVIYTGSAQVLVTNVVESADKLQAHIEGLGGFVLNRNGNTSSNNVTITVRTPAEHFHATVKALASYGQVINEQLNANDVTKQMFDTELRLETAERSRQRLLDLLKSATKMEEILQIENQVRRLTDEIERMKGELRFLQDQVAFSTLTVSFFSNAPPPTPGPLRVRSRFEWINQVGVEQVLGGF